MRRSVTAKKATLWVVQANEGGSTGWYDVDECLTPHAGAVSLAQYRQGAGTQYRLMFREQGRPDEPCE